METGKLMIYGATGYTGGLVVEEAAAQKMRPVLAGRSADRLALLGRKHGFDTRTAGLDDHGALCAALEDCDAVLHCAGPFTRTSGPMLAACLETGTDYLDITGEPGVIATCAGQDETACAVGITLMPSVGFDVVPTDCVAAMLAEKMPDASRLTLAFGGMKAVSRGTLRTGALFLGEPVYVREDGHLVPREAPPGRHIDFGHGPEAVIATNWGDLESAWHTTGIPAIEVFMRPSPEAARLFRMPKPLRRMLATPPGRWIVENRLKRMPPGPDAAQRRTGHACVYGRVENDAGKAEELRLRTPEPYALTARTAIRLARAVLAGEVAPGFQTPAMAMGGDFILSFDGCELIGNTGANGKEPDGDT